LPDLLFGSLVGKQAEQSLALLAQRVGAITLTTPESDRALDPAELALALHQLDERDDRGDRGDRSRDATAAAVSRLRVEPSIEAALTAALARAEKGLLVCGSLYLVGAVRRHLRELFGSPQAAVNVATS
jgi:folylpolyglutamate synthase/dihydropteroate synthase